MLKLAWNYMRYYKSQTFAVFSSILLTAALLAGISSLMYSSRKNDLANSREMYGDWHYCFETDQETYQSIQDSEIGDGYHLTECGKMEFRGESWEPFQISFLYADETCLGMLQREILEGTLPKQADEIAADSYVLSNLGFSGKLGDVVAIDGHEYRVAGILKSAWASNAEQMEVFVGDSFAGTERRTILYLRFQEDGKLYKQMEAFGKYHRVSFVDVQVNEEVVQYLGGEKPERVSDIVKFGLTQEEGNFTYIVLRLQSDYNIGYHGMVLLLCLFSLFVIYSVFSISAAKRMSEYAVMQTLGIRGTWITGTMILELWILFLAGYPAGCLLGNRVLQLLYWNQEQAAFFMDWSAITKGFVLLLAMLAAIGAVTMRSLQKRSLKEAMSGDISFASHRKIYAFRHGSLADVIVRKFMFSNKRKVIWMLLSLSAGGCIFLCTTYLVENLKIHAELSLKSDDGLGSEYRISLKSMSPVDVIPKTTAEKIGNIPELADVYPVKYMPGEVQLTEEEYLSDPDWSHYFDIQNQDAYFKERYGGICVKKADHMYGIKYNVYGYDDAMLNQLCDFILEGEIKPQDMESGNHIIITGNMDGQGNYYYYGKKPGDSITLRVPKKEKYTEECLKFEGSEENYEEKTFTIAAVVSRPLAQEQGFLNVAPWKNNQSIIMTDSQMSSNFGITDYSFINASAKSGADAAAVNSKILKTIQDLPRAVLQDYTAEIETQKNYLQRQQLFFSAVAAILLVISLFHILNSMNYSILARRREYGIMRAMGITDIGFYRMIAKAGILYGIMTDVLLFVLYHLVFRRIMDYYMTHIVQFLHLTAGVPVGVFAGIMALNVLIALIAVLIPARRLLQERQYQNLK